MLYILQLGLAHQARRLWLVHLVLQSAQLYLLLAHFKLSPLKFEAYFFILAFKGLNIADELLLVIFAARATKWL